MRLLTFKLGDDLRPGMLLDPQGEFVIDLASICSLILSGNPEPALRSIDAPALPANLKSLIPRGPCQIADILRIGDRAFDALKTIQQWASETGPGNLQCKTGRAQGGLVYQLKDLKLAAPLPMPSKFICLLHNYVDYLEGLNRPFPARPRFFAKFPTTIIGPGEYIIHPWLSRQVGYEAELAVVIGRRGKSIPEEEAYDYVAGYTIVNDISAVDIIAQDGQVMCGKNFDTFAPMGPWIITKDEIPDPQNLRICLDVNGRVLQDSNTSKMLFPIPVVISYLSKVMTLEPGDIIATGTPAGTPQFYDPPAFLDPGDIVTAEVEYIGHLTNPVIQEVSS